MLGYADDDESIASIMKKFEEVDAYKESNGCDELNTDHMKELMTSTEVGSIAKSFRQKYVHTGVVVSSDSEEFEIEAETGPRPQRIKSFLNPVE